MIEVSLDRRCVIGGLVSASLASCATTSPGRSLHINLQSEAAFAPAPGNQGLVHSPDELRAGFDAVHRMTVPVRIPPMPPFRFVVDTGANRSALAENIVAALGLPISGQVLVHGIGGAASATTVRTPRMEVGKLVLRRMQMPVLSRDALGADGLLGVDALKDRHVALDFTRNELVIHGRDSWQPPPSRAGSRAPPPSPDASVVIVPARHRFGQLTIVDAEVGMGLPITVFLDSGAQSTVGNLALRDSALRHDPALALRTTRVQLVGATGQTVSGDLARLPGLRLGGLRIGNLSCVFADLHTFKIWGLDGRPAMLIGMDVMRHFSAIELDFARRRVIFRAPSSATPR